MPILVYHRFGPTSDNPMMVRTSVFALQLEALSKHGYEVIPLRQLVDYLRGKGPAPPPRSVVITVDDARESVFTNLFPIIMQMKIPVTLFVYPSAVGNASYAMTWKQLREMRASGLVDIQSHTYWHPNFKVERQRRSPRSYAAFVSMQLTHSREVLERELDVHVDMLAWPFGVYDKDLMRRAADEGYVAAFTLERRNVSRRDDLMALPRYLMVDDMQGAQFIRMLSGGEGRAVHENRAGHDNRTGQGNQAGRDSQPGREAR